MAIVMAWGAMQRDVLSFPRTELTVFIVFYRSHAQSSRFLSFPRSCVGMLFLERGNVGTIKKFSPKKKHKIRL
jgi:hypothetical protein